MAQGDGQSIDWLEEIVGQLIEWHDAVIEQTGGLQGMQAARLYSSCARPFQTAFGQEIYESKLHKIAALFHSIIQGHPFADGNKRTAALAAIFYLGASGYLTSDPTKFQVRLLGELAVETAASGLSVEEVQHWIERIFAP